jgi:hypothetical protein
MAYAVACAVTEWNEKRIKAKFAAFRCKVCCSVKKLGGIIKYLPFTRRYFLFG